MNQNNTPLFNTTNTNSTKFKQQMPPKKETKDHKLANAERLESAAGKLTKGVMPTPYKPKQDQVFEADIDSITNVLNQKNQSNKYPAEFVSKSGKQISTAGAHLKMAELNFDPLAMSVAIAKGELLTKDHPFLVEITAWCFKRLADLEKGAKIDWNSEIEIILEKARESLTDSHTPINIRSDHVKELMSYLYPKLKATEHTGTIEHHLKVKPLTSEEVLTFRRTFNEEY